MQVDIQNNSFLHEKRTFHSLQTYFYKYLLPLTFVPWDGFGSILDAFPRLAPIEVLYAFFVAWLILTPVVFWWGFKVKRVIVDGEWLIVKGYWNESTVPLAEVESIEERKWPIELVVLKLKRATQFGHQINFIPKRMDGDAALGGLLELRTRIDQAKANQLYLNGA